MMIGQTGRLRTILEGNCRARYETCKADDANRQDVMDWIQIILAATRYERMSV